MYEFTVDGANINILMFTRSGVPQGIAEEMLGLMLALTGWHLSNAGYMPEWTVQINNGRIELHAQINGCDINVTERR